MSTPAACLMLSQFVPATARLLAEFMRLRAALPPAALSSFDTVVDGDQISCAELVREVCMCVPH